MIKILFSRVFVLYLVVIVAGYFGLSHQKAIDKAKLQTLNRLLPPQQTFKDFYKGELVNGEKFFDRYLHYYTKVEQFVPQSKENALSLQGYSYFKLNNLEKAILSYEKARDLNPQFFWNHYNLGLLYMKQSEYTQAAKSFQTAMQTKPDISLKIILSSKIYQQLLTMTKEPGPLLTEGIKTGYEDCYKYLILAKQLERGVKINDIDQKIDSFNLSIF